MYVYEYVCIDTYVCIHMYSYTHTSTYLTPASRRIPCQQHLPPRIARQKKVRTQRILEKLYQPVLMISCLDIAQKFSHSWVARPVAIDPLIKVGEFVVAAVGCSEGS